MRFRHNECGDFYTRALAIYAVWQAWLGLLVDVPACSLHLKPTARQTALRSPFLCGAVWGRMTILQSSILTLLQKPIKHEGLKGTQRKCSSFSSTFVHFVSFVLKTFL